MEVSEILFDIFWSTVEMSYPANDQEKKYKIFYINLVPKSFAERDRGYEEYVSEGAQGNE